MFAQKPSNQHQVVHVVLAVQISKLLVEVADGLPLGALRAHLLVVHVDLWGDGTQVLIVKVHSVTKALDSSLESPILHTMKFD